MAQKSGLIQLSQILNMTSPEAILEEVKHNFIKSYKIQDFSLMRTAYTDLCNLYSGSYPGYTDIRNGGPDITSCLEVCLAFSRLVDGYNIENRKLPKKRVLAVMITSLFLGSGYIVKKNESASKLNNIHNFNSRNLDFIRNYLKKAGYDMSYLDYISSLLFNAEIGEKERHSFSTKNETVISNMFATASIISWLSGRRYLESQYKLYDEIRRAKFITEDSIAYTFKERIKFYHTRIKSNLKNDFSEIYKLYKIHFSRRYGIKRNLYIISIERQISYMKKILELYPKVYKKKLKRGPCQ